jgi:hypothetical protein
VKGAAALNSALVGDDCHTDEFYWICMSASQWADCVAAKVLKLETETYGNESLATTAYAALTHTCFRMDCDTARLKDTDRNLLVIGLRLDCKELHKLFKLSALSQFNRLYTAYFLTVYNNGLQLTDKMLDNALVLMSHWSYDTWSAETVCYLKHCQLVWHGLAPAPAWLSTAFHDMGDSGDSDVTVTTAPPAQASASTGQVTAATTSSSATASDTVEMAKLLAAIILNRH